MNKSQNMKTLPGLSPRKTRERKQVEQVQKNHSGH